jgi:hypothetical protein
MTRFAKLALAASAAVLALCASSAQAQGKIGDVFVIAMENQNSTVNGANASGLNPIYGNPAAPYINSLITPGNPNAQYTAYSSAYHDVVVNSSTDLHPSEPNYVYQISGVIPPLTDNTPSVANNNLYPVGTPNLGTSLTNAGLTWKSYQEGIDSTGGNGSSAVVTNTIAPQSSWTVPNANFSGANPAYTNPYNGSDQYNYAAKHNPFVFFKGDYQPLNYAPLQQLSTDLANNTVANFNWITPDQYNDMHTALNGGFTYKGVHYTGNQANIAQGDNFLSQVVPMIEASQAFQDNGLIVIWTDEDEGDTPSTNQNYSNMEILIGHDTLGNAFTDFVPMNHGTDLQTYLELYGLNESGYPSSITTSNDFSSLLKPGAISGAVPEPSTWAFLLVGVGALGCALRQARRKAMVAA